MARHATEKSIRDRRIGPGRRGQRRWALRAATIVGGLLVAGVTATGPAAALPGPGPIIDHIGAVAWGANGSGQLGDRTVVDRRSPVEVYGLVSGAVQVAAGAAH